MESYKDLLVQNFPFPQEEFNYHNGELLFHGIGLMELVEKHGTPLKISCLPVISNKIQFCRDLFKQAIQKHNYEGSYTYCYCSKSSHFKAIIDEVLSNNVQLETSSAYDMSLVNELYKTGKITTNTLIIANGFKRQLYLEKLVESVQNGMNCIPVLDNQKELDYYRTHLDEPFNIGIRVATEEEPNFSFYTSRLGINPKVIPEFVQNQIASSSNINLKVLHFFINQGISDRPYYWNELAKVVRLYCELKRQCPELDSLDIGGGFPIKTDLNFHFDYGSIIDEIVSFIKNICDELETPCPNLITEFGSFTVGESGCTLYSILDEKRQNDREAWYMIDGSFITQLPDTWSLNQQYILLPVNNWDRPYKRVHLGGLTCDSQDYYNTERHKAEIFLPQSPDIQGQVVGFFHTGAYQESLGGVGGIQHCLVPYPKHISLQKTKDGTIVETIINEEQSENETLKTLGY